MRETFVTLICGGDDYVPGAEALGHSIRLTATTRPMMALVTADVSDAARGRLEEQGWLVREVIGIANPSQEQALLFHRFGPVYTKLRVWELTDFDTVVYLDADTLVLHNVDELFARPGFAAAPDFFLPDRFNSGVMVVKPNLDRFAEMTRRLPETESYDGGDQGFLNTLHGDWWTSGPEQRLPTGYNFHNFVYEFMTRNELLWKKLEPSIKVIHYTLHKPWLKSVPLAGGVKLWWDMYSGVHPGASTRFESSLHGASDWIFDKMVDALVS